MCLPRMRFTKFDYAYYCDDMTTEGGIVFEIFDLKLIDSRSLM